MRERSIILTYVAALLAFGAIAVIIFINFAHFGERAGWVRHTQEVISELDRTLGELKNVETGQRGYLIAGNEDFLVPYERGVEQVYEHLDRAEALTVDNPAQQERIAELRPVIDEKLAFSAQTIARFQQGDRAGARDMVAERRGQSLMDDIRVRVGELQQEEQSLLLARTQRAEAAAWRASVLIIFGNAFGFAFLASGTLLLGRELNRRKRLEQDVAFQGQRAELLERAELAHRRLEAVVDEMPLSVAVVEARSKHVTLDNVRMRELYGAPLARPRPYSEDDAEDKAPQGVALALVRADGTPYPAGSDPIARALSEGTVTRGEEVELACADGTSRKVVASIAPVRDREGRHVAAVAAFQDASELKRSEEERLQATRFRDVFLSALGHDLRNPLTVISAGAASLARRAQTPAETKVISHMASSAERISRMVGQLIDLTQARLGEGVPLEPERADLGELARRVVEHMEVAHPDHSIELSAEGELVGSWDPKRIQQLLEELVGNALVHGMPRAKVRVSLRSDGDEIIGEVHNRGNPIPPDLLPLVFDPFRRAAERKRMKSVGLGLGLYLALQIARAHGGAINVTSDAATGTVFRFTLPRSDVSAD